MALLATTKLMNGILQEKYWANENLAIYGAVVGTIGGICVGSVLSYKDIKKTLHNDKRGLCDLQTLLSHFGYTLAFNVVSSGVGCCVGFICGLCPLVTTLGICSSAGTVLAANSRF